MTIRILSPHCARTDFIEYQSRSLAKFFLDEYELIILNDAKDPKTRKAISLECNRLDVMCYETPDDLIHSSGPVACAAVLQWAWDDLVIKHYTDDVVIFLDSDMFMIREFSAKQFLGDAVIAGVPQHRGVITYFWNGIMLFDVPRMPHPDRLMLYCGIVRGQNVDVGGMMYYYFAENSEVIVKAVPHTSHIHSSNSNLHVLPTAVRDKYQEDYRIEICAGSFLHYGSGTNWQFTAGSYEFLMGGDCMPPKTEFVFWFLEELLSSRVAMPEVKYIFSELGSGI